MERMPAKHLRHSTVRFIICSLIREYHTWDNEKKCISDIFQFFLCFNFATNKTLFIDLIYRISQLYLYLLLGSFCQLMCFKNSDNVRKYLNRHRKKAGP